MNYLDTFRNNRFVHYAKDGEETSNWWNDFFGAVRDLNQIRINNPAGIDLRNSVGKDRHNDLLQKYTIANALGITNSAIPGYLKEAFITDEAVADGIWPLLGLGSWFSFPLTGRIGADWMEETLNDGNKKETQNKPQSKIKTRVGLDPK